MDLSNFRRMDPNMLYSIINMKLRNDYRDPQDLARSLDLPLDDLLQRLADAGFVYDAQTRQFRPRAAP